MTKPNVVLHVADVHKRFGGLHALADIDLQVEEGKTHAIIGPNGAGKSTLLNVIIGKLAPSSGQVVFDGTMLTGRKPHRDQPARALPACSRRRKSSPTCRCCTM